MDYEKNYLFRFLKAEKYIRHPVFFFELLQLKLSCIGNIAIFLILALKEISQLTKIYGLMDILKGFITHYRYIGMDFCQVETSSAKYLNTCV